MRFRMTQAADFSNVLEMMPPSYRYSPEILKNIPKLWTNLLRDGSLLTVVFEDTASGEMLGMGVSAFLNDDFVDEQLANPTPYVNKRIHEMLMAGNSPILSANEIGEANGNSGVNLMPMHFFTPPPDFSNPETLKVLAAAKDLFRIMHAGFNIKRILYEVVDINLMRAMQAAGLTLLSDYADADPGFGLEKVPEEIRPYLLYASHEDLPMGSDIALMFIKSPVHFHFTPAEQKILLCAMLRENDEEIASDLHIAPDTVRKHWKSIFQRVQDSNPTFFEDGSESKANEGTRGRGKRRQLLRYLQLHMEELRPHKNGR